MEIEISGLWFDMILFMFMLRDFYCTVFSESESIFFITLSIALPTC
jgi:hypothetical protein